jgi:hypothetical protein
MGDRHSPGCEGSEELELSEPLRHGTCLYRGRIPDAMSGRGGVVTRRIA